MPFKEARSRVSFQLLTMHSTHHRSASLFRVQSIFWGPVTVDDPPPLSDLLEILFLRLTLQQDRTATTYNRYDYCAIVIKAIEYNRSQSHPARIIHGIRSSKKCTFWGLGMQDATRCIGWCSAVLREEKLAVSCLIRIPGRC